MSQDRIATAQEMIARYNAQDADAYVELMTDDACEASYRGAVLREGKEGVRSGLAKTFADYPENNAQIVKQYALGETVVFEEYVTRGPRKSDGFVEPPFTVLAIYSFEGDKCSRVEFIR
ncbi:MAG TPA: nuclear transport factor 2 family protein [Sphingobium sp.]|nr:nuclear transport factor 2 family protein [Sphingobium sp.]